MDRLVVGLAAGDPEAARAAAAELRRRVRTDETAWREAAARLLDPTTPEALREALAFVLGTIESPRTDALLLEALAKFGGTPAFARAALLALGTKRGPPEEDDVFGMGDRPWGAQGPSGLGVTVRREIAEETTRAAVASRLARAEEEVRRAAALALRHSLAEADARTAFEQALSSETADVVAQELGEALVQTARASDDAGERSRVVGLVLRRAASPPLEGLRFRLEDDLRATPLDDDARLALVEIAKPSRPFGERAFAMTVLAEREAGDPETTRTARALLVGALGADEDPAARDLAARLLSLLPADSASTATLARAARDDRAWNVRYTALESLAKVAGSGARDVLSAAAGDPDERVAARARELLGEKR